MKQPKTEKKFVMVIVEDEANQKLLTVLRDLYGERGIWLINKARLRSSSAFRPVPENVFWTYIPTEGEVSAAKQVFPDVCFTYLAE